MKLTGDEARMVVCDDNADWEEVSGTRHTVDHTRWSVVYEAVFLHRPSGKHYFFVWAVGATESQDQRPYEDEDEVELTEAVQKEITRVEWVRAEAEEGG